MHLLCTCAGAVGGPPCAGQGCCERPHSLPSVAVYAATCSICFRADAHSPARMFRRWCQRHAGTRCLTLQREIGDPPHGSLAMEAEFSQGRHWL
jgi:hypothetical protein